jgi:curved DNA-binding protein CbpA
MINNRRNYYRILHVQPEAPTEIIKASYRSLMTKLNAHPDRGGDHEAAVLINQAYAVLMDPQKRRKYDEMLLARNSDSTKRSYNEAPYKQATSSTDTSGNAYRNNRENARSAPATERRYCFFCGNGHSMYVNKHCARCESPLAPARPAYHSRLPELFGRRTVPRIAKTGVLVIYPTWPHSGYPAQLRDLSTSGFSISTSLPVKTGQIIKFDSTFLKGVAKVVTVGTNGVPFTVHATFLSAEFITKSGVFVAEKA